MTFVSGILELPVRGVSVIWKLNMQKILIGQKTSKYRKNPHNLKEFWQIFKILNMLNMLNMLSMTPLLQLALEQGLFLLISTKTSSYNPLKQLSWYLKHSSLGNIYKFKLSSVGKNCLGNFIFFSLLWSLWLSVSSEVDRQDNFGWDRKSLRKV